MISFRQAQIQQPVQEHTELVGSPRVSIEPAFAARIQRAVDIVNQHNPELLRDVTDIVGHMVSGPFGQYNTGAPHTIFVNIPKIEQEVRSKLSGQPEQAIQQEVDNQIVKTIMHEATHRKEFTEMGYSSETGPDAAEKLADNFLPVLELQPAISSRHAAMLRLAYIKKMDSKWCVLSRKGKKLGCYKTKGEAVKRLRQVEYFKKHKK
jgi:flavin-binding protein dodecin